MIDVEADVFDTVARAIYALSESAYISSRHFIAPPQFPAISIIEKTNLSHTESYDSSGREKASSLTYVIDVYSNSEKKAKQECKKIMKVIADTMNTMNFTRTFCEVSDNVADPNIYRMTARFAALVDESNVLYRR